MKTWRWTKEFRKSNKNIGVDWLSIFVDLKLLMEDIAYQIENKTYPIDELAVRLQTMRQGEHSDSLDLFETKGLATLSEIHDLSKQDSFFEWLLNEITENEEKFSKFLKRNSFALLVADEKT